MTTLGQPIDGRTTLRVLSLWQPWATLLVAGAKTIETRCWPTPHRGPVLIHASKAWSPDIESLCGDTYFAEALGRLGYISPFSTSAQWKASQPTWRDLPRGAVVGCVDLVGVHPTEEIVEAGLGAREMALGDFSPGRYGWCCARPKRFVTPVRMRGEQGLFYLKTEFEAAVREQFAVADNDTFPGTVRDARGQQTGR